MRSFCSPSRPIVLLLVSSVALFILSGCVGGKKVVTPYPGNGPGQGYDTAQDVHQSSSFTRDTLNPALAWIGKRIEAYGDKTREWQQLGSKTAFMNLGPAQVRELSSCRLQATDLLAGYNRVQDQLLAGQPQDVVRWMLRHTLADLKQKDIAYLDGPCQRLYVSLAESPAPQVDASLASVEISMKSAFSRGDYDQVIREFRAISLPPGQLPGYGVSVLYGMALLKTGRVQDARMVFSDLLSRERGAMKGSAELELLEKLGDIDFGLGDFDTAHSFYEQYERIAFDESVESKSVNEKKKALERAAMHRGEVQAYAALLLSSLTNNPRQDGFTLLQQTQAFQRRYPLSSLNENVQSIAQKASAEAEQWFAGIMTSVDQLVDKGEKAQALQLIEDIHKNILPLDKQAILRLKKVSLVGSGSVEEPKGWRAEESTIEEEVLQTTESAPSIDDQQESVSASSAHVPVTKLQETWNQGMADMRAKEYDQAIIVFTGLKNTSLGYKAGNKIAEACRLAAREKRKKAAELFMRANRATRVQARKELLLSSKQLLEEILEKYSQAGLGAKVRRNLHRIEGELAALKQGNTPVPMEGSSQGKDNVRDSQLGANAGQ